MTWPGKATSRSDEKYYVPALEKGLDILEALVHTSQPITLTELARRLDRSASELFRVLNTLEARHYVEKDPNTGTYSLSLKLYKMAHQHAPELNLLLASTLAMERFVRDTGESCHLGVMRSGKLVILREILAPGPVRVSVQTGGEFSMVYTTSGRLLIALLSPAAQQSFFALDEEFLSLNALERQAFQEQLAIIRQKGFSTSVSENHVGICDAAVPLGIPETGLVAALACTWLTSTTSNADRSHEIVTALGFAAESVAAALGLAT